jgi:hypothetical protein
MWKKRILGFVTVIALLGALAFGAILWCMHSSVRHYCAMAQKTHPNPGDDVTCLIEFIESEDHSFRDRNRAVWTLGRLRDSTALPALESAYTGGECRHDEKLCQHELEKAIRLCRGKLKTKAGGR